jgi:subtilase family serine protease
MLTTHKNTFRLMLLFAFVSIVALPATAQTNQARSLVTKPVNESQMVTLQGNTHPLARAEFDRGAAPASLPMENMMLVLKRSPEQDAALATLLQEQLEVNSPNYHKWVTPEEFGARFGPSDHDIQAVTSWLQSHGFAVLEVTPGRNLVVFSGTAAQVESALHTSIHSYVVRGEQHWANASDPQIPAALSSIVAGVNTLHNFRKKPMSHTIGTFSRSNATGAVKPLHPQFTFPAPTGNTCGLGGSTCFALGPFDFATIYNVLPLWNANIDGTGETIAVVGDSNINIADVRNFRKIFGLPEKDPIVIIADNGKDPGIQPNGDEIEADLDVQWSGGIAKNATIDFVISADTNTAAGVDLAAMHIINHNLAPVMSESFGACEFQLGTAGNAMFNSLWSQGASQGITIVVSTGDNGAAGCDFANQNTNNALAASSGLQVSGLASTQFNVAVGGTDFDQLTNATTFWNSTNATSTQASAKGYIPETTWNDSCTNIVWLGAVDFVPELSCNDAALASVINPIGASGGVSNCTTSTQGQLSSCNGGNAKPSFQIGPGVPNDGKRDIPDVSLFAGDGLLGSFYAICQQDQITNMPANTPCSLADPNSDIVGVGGTSVSAQTFAGIMALVVQKTGSRQGMNANKLMYELAETQSISGCNASSSPASTCVFNDVTKGTISQPCVRNSLNCVTIASTDSNGILGGCDAGPGFDLATGLGSVNAENLVNNFTKGAGPGTVDFSLSLTNCSSTIQIPGPGSSGSIKVLITEVGGFNSALTFTCAPIPSEATCNVTTSMVDATHISATVTVTTVAASKLIPAGRPAGRGLWMLGGTATLVYFLGILTIGIVLMGFRSKQARLSTAIALMAFATLVTMAACGGGGGGGGGGNPGTPTGVTNPTLTATGGGTSHSMNFTLIVD